MNDGTHGNFLVDEFVGYALEQIHPQLRAWQGTQAEIDSRKALEGLVSLLTDDEEAGRYAQAMNVLGLPQEHYKAKLIEVHGHRFLAQIDFPDTSGKTPFVAVLRGSQPLGSFADDRVVQAIAASFSVFNPVTVRFFHPAHMALQLPGPRVDQHFLVGQAREMAAHSPTAGSPRVALIRPTSLAFYPRYVEAYEQVLSVRPHLRGDVRIETEETLAECLAQDLLFEIMVDGAWAGIVAAMREMLAGVDAVYMIEILLEQWARGQALGPAVHRAFASHVALTDPRAVIAGTIAPTNVPSLKTAQRAKRERIGDWYWYEV